MKHGSPTRLCLWITSTLLVMGALGCATWNRPLESVIHIDAKQNPAKAQRLTLAGVKALDDNEIDRATTKFISAIAADPTYGPAHNNLGLLHFDQGNLYQAVLAFEQAMEYMPADPIVFYNLGLTLESAGKVHQARELYEQAVAADPVNPVFLGNLVRLQVRLGETGPEVETRLQDLILIETRADWRRWADGLLALEFNDALDRGPETPDFNTGDDDAAPPEFRIEDRVIELTPDRDGGPPMDFKTSSPTDLSLQQPEPIMGQRSQPLPIRDSSPIEVFTPGSDQLPPSDFFDPNSLGPDSLGPDSFESNSLEDYLSP